jgi:membrane associated rhomboid family serine protease
MGVTDRTYYRDEVPGLRPWDRYSMITNVIIINVAIMFANLLFTSRDNGLVELLLLRPGDLVRPLDWYRFLTYGFTHEPRVISHILFNMLSLYFLGQAVEQRYGRWEFLRFYLVTIVLGGLVYCLIRLVVPGAGNAPVLGASGGVVGVVMLFVYNYPQATLMLWGVVPVKAWLIGVITVLINVFGTQSHVAYDVHLTGIAFATLYYFGHWNLGVLGQGWSHLSGSLKRKPKLRVHSAEDDSPSSRDEVEADRLLDKIYREGQSSLTPKEQQFLERYSRRVRQKRGS